MSVVSSSISSSKTQPSRLIQNSRNAGRVPTILELGRMKTGALKVGLIARKSAGSISDNDECDDNIDIKLRWARRLAKARAIGIPITFINLRDYSRQGGHLAVAQELVRQYSQSAADFNTRLTGLRGEVERFCEYSEISFDQMLLEYASSICDKKNSCTETIAEAASISRCCRATTIKCRVVLIVLRAALSTGIATPCLKKLASDSIEWTGGDEKMKSELVEVARLLSIDRLVRRFCGTAAAMELFRVDNPAHAVRLLAYLCRHVRCTTVLDDAFELCDAFTHLSRHDACIQILEATVLCGDTAICQRLLLQMFQVDERLAEHAFRRVISFCSHQLHDICTQAKGSTLATMLDECKAKVRKTCNAALSLFEVGEDCFTKSSKHWFRTWHVIFQRVVGLQAQHDLLVSPIEMKSEQSLLQFVAASVQRLASFFSQSLSSISESIFEDERRKCWLFWGSNDEILDCAWYHALGKEAKRLALTYSGNKWVVFLQYGGAIKNQHKIAALEALLGVFTALWSRSTNSSFSAEGSRLTHMEHIVSASQQIQHHCISGCPRRMIDVVSQFSVLADLTTEILLRSDKGVGEALDHHRRNSSVVIGRGVPNQLEYNTSTSNDMKARNKVKLHPSWYVGDGVLLPVDETLQACADYCCSMVEELVPTFEQEPRLTTPLDAFTDLYGVLHTMGAHSACTRVGCVACSYVVTDTCSRSLDQWNGIDDLATSFQQTAKAMAERSLGGGGNGITSSLVDSQLAVSYLLLLSKKLAVKVSKCDQPKAHGVNRV